jgi:hypothetical protein
LDLRRLGSDGEAIGFRGFPARSSTLERLKALALSAFSQTPFGDDACEDAALARSADTPLISIVHEIMSSQENSAPFAN